MPLYRYYISGSPGDPSPPGNSLRSIEAASTAEAVAKLQRGGLLPEDWQALWIHFLVWVDQEGQQRGFESMPLGKFNASDERDRKEDG